MSSISEMQHKVRQANKLRITNNVKDNKEEQLNMSSYSGIVEYFPEELVITLKAGTTIDEVNKILSKNNQALAFFTGDSKKTIGSLYATSGAEFSDSVLGVQIINGKGELLNFGGQVMKNVAGYDVSRLLVGSMGRLAIITQISLKILPEKVAVQFHKKPSIKNKESSLREQVEIKLKKVFDPYGVFI
ncbi:FAD-binding protein [Candidatus Pseudothioglobus sp. Uisw_041]|jgi:glycolate oxidase FAD binding subunit|uniref:FAD-binding protein n=1 Tax=Candidatus Pseudothioglobus sp. Uisw_041 TaxID=3230996 RepID=UPI002371E35C|nr:FAD-binding protein [Candidatus Thioglobus sp.]